MLAQASGVRMSRPYSASGGYKTLIGPGTSLALAAGAYTAICERVIGTLRRELLDRILILSERHLARVLREYLIHDNGHRPHQSRRQRPPDIATQPARDVTDLDDLRSIRRKPAVAGMISEYHHAA
jgi:hypothetical protein